MQSLWEQCKKELEKEVGQHNYISYIQPTRQLEYSNNELAILVPSTFLADWLEKHYLVKIKKIVDGKTETKNRVALVVDKNTSRQVEVRNGSRKVEVRAPAPTVKKARRLSAPQLISQYSFESFVVGKCNEFAYASALTCTKKPGMTYNPLFLYGGVGLGKTHLMQSIGREILDKKPSASVLYLSSEDFVNQMIAAMRKNQMDQFRRKYRNLDVLLVDDIQFIAGKDRSQEEFFHTFNTLFEMGKQVVVSSDQFPQNIVKLEERLKSRFQCGLIADIMPPSFETKIAIINKKAELNGYHIPPDVAEYLALTIKSNIRELEGCLTRIVTYSSLSGQPISLPFVKETMDSVYAKAKRRIDVARIQKAVVTHFSLKLSDMKSKNRSRKIVAPRQLAMYLCREYTDESLPQIGKFFGGKDHSTVIHAHKKVEKYKEVNTKLYNDLKDIERILEV